MAKLKLSLEQLEVDSFDTAGVEGIRGTVRGEQCTCYTECTCPGCNTCDSCQMTCYGTCAPDYSCNTYETFKDEVCCLQ